MRRDRGQRRRPRSDAGQAAVELAMVLPVVFLLLVGILQAGMFYYRKLAVRQVTQEAARFAVTGNVLPDGDSGRMLGRAASIESFVERRARQLSVEVDDVTLDPADGGQPGDVVRVTVESSFPLIPPTLHGEGPRLRFSARVAMRNEPLF